MNKYEFRELMVPPLRQIADSLGYPYIEPVFLDDSIIKFNSSTREVAHAYHELLEKYTVYLKEVNAKKLVFGEAEIGLDIEPCPFCGGERPYPRNI